MIEEKYIEELHTCDIDTKVFSLNGMETYARVVDIYDGDTMTCVLPLFNDYYKFIVRLDGIDTCEIRNKNANLKQKGLLAKKLIIDTLLPDNKCELDITRNDLREYLKKHVVIVWLKCLEFDKYGRLLGDVFVNKESDKSLSNVILDNKLGYIYNGGSKLEESQQENL